MVTKQPTKLNSAKNDLKQIEKFCKTHPLPSTEDLGYFIKENEFERYAPYANALLLATTEKEWILFQNKTNKYR